MFGHAKPKLAITEEQRDWIDRSLVPLGGLVGAHRLFEAELMLPTAEHFPNRYDRSEAAVQRMFHRIAARMHVNPAEVEEPGYPKGRTRTDRERFGRYH